MLDNGQPGLLPVARTSILSIFGWIFGGLFGVVGLMMLLLVPDASGRLAGLSFGIIALLMLPPVVKALRSKLKFMRPVGVPTFIGFGLGLTALATFSPFVADPASSGKTVSSAPIETAAETPAEPKFTPPITPVNIVGEDDPMWRSQEALNKGDITTAVTSFYSSDVPQERRNSAQGLQLKAAIQSAMDAGSGSTPDDRAERAFQTQLANVEALEAAAPDNPIALWRRVDALSEAARVLQEHPPASLTPDAARSGARLRDALVSRQRKDFPILRKAYGEILGRAAWEQDIEVTVQGTGNKTIRFIGGTFAANRNVASAQAVAQPNVDKLRFGRTQYEWYRGSEGQTYTLTTPSDGAVGLWENGRFVEVQTPG